MKSFDIFDTVLVRKCGSAENLFFLLAYRIYKKDSSQRDAFYKWRCYAEDIARNKFMREPSLQDIYSTLDKKSFSDINPCDALSTELELEKENLIPNKEVCSMLENLDDYIFISDMYHSSSFLRQILNSFGLLKKIKRKNSIYISCEYNATKATGKLYEVVKRELGISTWTHYGDNNWSDIKQAKKKGLQAIKINTDYSKPEKFYIDHVSFLPNKIKFDILIGLLKATRLNSGNNREAFAIDCIAPLYIGYINHIMETAKERGISTLYFLSRDSYILYKIAQQYKSKYPQISLKYLFVSRKSLIYPCIYEGTSDEIRELMGLESFKGVNIKRITNYLQLDKNAFDNLGFIKIKTEENIKKFEKALDYYCKTIKNRSEADRQILLKYFKQEGLLNSEKKAIVDVGWLGTSRHLINKILINEGYNKVETFYLMNFSRVLPPSSGIYNSFLGECDFKSPAIPIIEILHSASPFQSTLSYKIHNNRVTPIFNPSTKPANTVIIKNNLFGVLKIVKSLKQYDIDFLDIFPLMSKLSVLCISRPQNIDVANLANLEDQDETGKMKNLIERFSYFDILRFLFNYKSSLLSSYSIYYSYPKLAPYILFLHSTILRVGKKIKYIVKLIIR